MDYNYNYTYDNSAGDAGVNAAVISGLVAFLIFFGLLSYAVVAFLLGKIFQKAGVPQWAAWVPVYNNWKLLEIGGQQGFWAILMFIPFVNIISAIFMYISMYHVGRKLNKEGWFVLLAIFLPLVWLIWLAFDDSKWPREKSAEAKPASVKKPATRKKR